MCVAQLELIGFRSQGSAETPDEEPVPVVITIPVMASRMMMMNTGALMIGRVMGTLPGSAPARRAPGSARALARY